MCAGEPFITVATYRRIYFEVFADDQHRPGFRRSAGNKRDINGVLHHLVDSYPTLLSECSLGHAEELMDKLEADVGPSEGFQCFKRGGCCIQWTKSRRTAWPVPEANVRVDMNSTRKAMFVIT
jgi:hypothetical protein